MTKASGLLCTSEYERSPDHFIFAARDIDPASVGLESQLDLVYTMGHFPTRRIILQTYGLVREYGL